MILLTGSRKSLLFVFMNIVIILYLNNRRGLKNKFKFFVLAGIILIIILYSIFNIPIFYQIIGYRMHNFFNLIFGHGTDEGSINIRLYMIKFGFELFQRRPLIGYGIDNYRFYFSKMPIGWDTYSHNNFIELMVGTGILGVLIYYLTHFIVLKKLFKTTKYSKDKIICYTFIAIIISYIILSMTLVYYYGKHFSFLLAVASVMGRIVKKDKQI